LIQIDPHAESATFTREVDNWKLQTPALPGLRLAYGPDDDRGDQHYGFLGGSFADDPTQGFVVMVLKEMGRWVCVDPLDAIKDALRDEFEPFHTSLIRRKSKWADAWRFATRLNVRLCGGLVHELDVEPDALDLLDYVYEKFRGTTEGFGMDFASPPNWLTERPTLDAGFGYRSLCDEQVPSWLVDINGNLPITAESIDMLNSELSLMCDVFLERGYELYRDVRDGSYIEGVRNLRDGGVFVTSHFFKPSAHELPKRCDFKPDGDGQPAKLKCNTCGCVVQSRLLAGGNSWENVYRACGADEPPAHGLDVDDLELLKVLARNLGAKASQYEWAEIANDYSRESNKWDRSKVRRSLVKLCERGLTTLTPCAVTMKGLNMIFEQNRTISGP
jgi:hypothetical protein